jgi:hypothetical protein
MQNKPNFMRFLPEKADFTKNKANSNPIKPKTNPICRKNKMNAFALNNPPRTNQLSFVFLLNLLCGYADKNV